MKKARFIQRFFILLWLPLMSIAIHTHGVESVGLDTPRMQEIYSLLADERFEEASYALNQITPDDSLYTLSLVLRGDVYFALGMYEEAWQQWSACLATSPETANLHYRIAGYYYKRQQIKEAFSWMEKGLAHDTIGNPAMWVYAGWLSEQKMPVRARTYIDSYLQHHEEKPAAEALFLKGMFLFEDERWEESVDFLGRAYQQQPDHSDFIRNYAISLHVVNRSGEALALFRKLSMPQEPIRVVFNAAGAAYRSGAYTQAIEWGEWILKKQPWHRKARDLVFAAKITRLWYDYTGWMMVGCVSFVSLLILTIRERNRTPIVGS